MKSMRQILMMPDRDLLISIGICLCLLNILLVLILAGTGVLKTAERNDVTEVQATHIDGKQVTLPPASAFIIEDPTDVDFFYNIAVHVRNGGSLYPGNGHDPFVQLAYKYAPVVFIVFYPLTLFGYFGFKLLWLVLSILSVITGTFLMVKAESHHRDFHLPPNMLYLLCFASIGFQPMVANLKTGQTTPFMYFFVALGWWLYRTDRGTSSGAVLAGTTVIKPYFTVPLIALITKNKRKPILGFTIAFIGMNIIGLIAFGQNTLIAYYEILVRFILAEGSSSDYGSLDQWSASHFRPLFWLGPWAPIARILFALPLVGASMLHFFERIDRPDYLLSLSVVSLMIFLETTTAIDIGLILIVLFLLGIPAYRENSLFLRLICIAFLFLMAHGYVLELLVGWGSTNIAFIASHSALIIPLLPLLQPATYAILILYGLSLYLFLSPFGSPTNTIN